MSACKTEDDCQSPLRCRHLDRCPLAESEHAPHEPQAHQARCAVLTGSSPVFAGNSFPMWLTHKIAAHQRMREACAIMEDYAGADRHRNYATAYEVAAYNYRLLTASATERQPGSNK